MIEGRDIRVGLCVAALAALFATGTAMSAAAQTSQMLKTSLVENGKPVQLEVVIFNPAAAGPFPLLVFNHGSTGTGRDRSIFRRTFWEFSGIAAHFTAKGWMVAFPQRRGRGKSDGLYDEGFNADRALGYACDDVRRSLDGAERGLKDIDAAVEALRQRGDVRKGPVLIAGQSRGGALSVAYAGRHPGKVLGVINFVGGWMGSRCINASRINWGVFNIGSQYSKDTLWLYAGNDRFYSLAHSEVNFDQFKSNGGKGQFVRLEVPSGDGHDSCANGCTCGALSWTAISRPWRSILDRIDRLSRCPAILRFEPEHPVVPRARLQQSTLPPRSRRPPGAT